MRERGTKWKRNLVSAFIILVMVLSVLAIMLSREEGTGQTKKYRDYKFTAKDNKWYLNTEGSNWVDFDYFPADVENISITGDIDGRILNTKMLYLTFNPENATKSTDKFRFDFTNLLANQYGIYVANSITKNSTQYILPLITCKNATAFVPVIELKFGNQTGIYVKDNCIIAEAQSSEDMTKLRDAVIYNLLGVVK